MKIEELDSEKKKRKLIELIKKYAVDMDEVNT